MNSTLTIVRVAAIGTEARLPETFFEARNLIDRERLILVRVESSESITGVSTISHRDMKGTIRALELFGEYLQNRPALDTAALWQAMFDVTTMAPGAVADKPLLAALKALPEDVLLAALAGIDLALWDLKGRALGQPFWRLAGGYSNQVNCYATGGYYRLGTSRHDPAAEIEAALTRGFRAFKMKVGAFDLDMDIERMRSARRAAGDETLLMIDGNQSYSLIEAKQAIARFSDYRPFWFEEPLLPAEPVTSFAQLHQFTPVALASGESEIHLGTCCAQIQVGGVEIMQFDATRYGGATGWLRLAAFAQLCGARMATHHNWHINAQLAASVPNGFFVEVHPDPARTVLAPQVIHGNPPVIDGKITLDETPGFGFEIDWERAETLRIA